MRSRRVGRGVAVGGVQPEQIGPAGEERVDRRALDQGADPREHRAQRGGHRLAEHPDLTAARRCQPQQQADRGGLARAVRPEEAEHGTARHAQIEGLDGALATEDLGQPRVSIAGSPLTAARTSPGGPIAH